MNLACSRREFPHVFSDLSVNLSLPARQKLGEALARLKLAVQNISHDVGLKKRAQLKAQSLDPTPYSPANSQGLYFALHKNV